MRTALLVEDVSIAQQWLSEVLNEAFPGIEITTCDTSSRALLEVHREIFDLALVDLSLPDGSGVPVIQALANRSPSTAIVVATIYDDDKHLFPALQAGAQGYLLKDQPKGQLVRQLQGILEGAPPLSPAIARRLLAHFQPRSEESGENLTARERDVLTLLARGIKIADIAASLDITRNTAAGYVKSIYRKLNISSRAQAALRASRMGLVEDEAAQAMHFPGMDRGD